MTSSPISSSKPEELDLTMIKLTGRCETHGNWERDCLKSLSSRMSGKCPECEKVAKPVSIQMQTVSGECEKHGEWSKVVPSMLAKKVEGKCPTCYQEAEEKRVQDEAARMQRSASEKKSRNISKLLDDSEIPRRFRERTFLNYNAESDAQKRALTKAKAFAERFPKAVEQGASFVFCGQPGTGKTHLACAIGNHVMKTFGNAVRFLTVFEVVQRVKSTYGNSEKTEADVMRSFAEPDLLILDEVGVQFGTEFEKVIITDIINRRYSDMRPTIILSNLTAEELAVFLGARVIDRMHEGGGGVIAFDWGSYRAKVAKDASLPGGQYRPVAWMDAD